jgi:hypothetical protein
VTGGLGGRCYIQLSYGGWVRDSIPALLTHGRVGTKS